MGSSRAIQQALIDGRCSVVDEAAGTVTRLGLHTLDGKVRPDAGDIHVRPRGVKSRGIDVSWHDRVLNLNANAGDVR